MNSILGNPLRKNAHILLPRDLEKYLTNLMSIFAVQKIFYMHDINYSCIVCIHCSINVCIYTACT